MACALAESHRFELAVYSGPPLGLDWLRRRGHDVPSVPDFEEVLAAPDIEAVIVAGGLGVRAAQVRRALQAERHVLCVHPIDSSADAAYEVALLQEETGRVVLPLIAEAFHPGMRRLADFLRSNLASPPSRPQHRAGDDSVVDLGGIRPGTAGPALAVEEPEGVDLPVLLEVERWALEEVARVGNTGEDRFHLPGWDALRFLGGEIVEVMALSGPEEEYQPARPLLLQGRFEADRLFRALHLPNQPEAQLRLSLQGAGGRAELLFPLGWPGPSRLSWLDGAGTTHAEDFEAFHPWQALTEAFAAALERLPKPGPYGTGRATPECWTRTGRLGWQDELRALELDDAVRRSLARRRASSLDLQEVGEEAGFKGTMTLVGCSLLWFSLVLLILSVWLPFLGWLILPVFGVFLVLQMLGWAVKKE